MKNKQLGRKRLNANLIALVGVSSKAVNAEGLSFRSSLCR